MEQAQPMSSPLLAELTPHPVLFSCCTFQPPVGSQVSAQEGQGSPSAVWGSLPFGPGYRGLAWMETLLSSELGRERVLGVRTELGDHPAKVQHREHQGRTPSGVRHCFGVHARSLHVASRFWKAVHSPDPDGVEGSGSVTGLSLEGSCPTAPHAHSHPKRGEALWSQEAHWSSWLTAAYAPPAGAAGRDLRCARS